MDKKTMEKVINGMAEKLEKYIDNTNKELKTLGIYKDDRCDNYPVIESLIKLNKKVDSLGDRQIALENKIDNSSTNEPDKCTKPIINPFHIFHISSFSGH